MKVEEYSLAKIEAEKAYNELKDLFKNSVEIKRKEIYRDLKRVYGHMTHGRKIIDVEASMKKAGVNIKGEPNLAICRADAITCHLSRNLDGSAVFSWKEFRWAQTRPRKSYGEFGMPSGSYGELWKNLSWSKRLLKAPVPLIPPPILIEEIKHKLKNYHIIWEVEEWTPEPPIDPILLKRLTPTLFAVLATWDLTELERAVIRGHVS